MLDVDREQSCSFRDAVQRRHFQETGSVIFEVEQMAEVGLGKPAVACNLK